MTIPVFEPDGGPATVEQVLVAFSIWAFVFYCIGHWRGARWERTRGLDR